MAPTLKSCNHCHKEGLQGRKGLLKHYVVCPATSQRQALAMQTYQAGISVSGSSDGQSQDAAVPDFEMGEPEPLVPQHPQVPELPTRRTRAGRIVRPTLKVRQAYAPPALPPRLPSPQPATDEDPPLVRQWIKTMPNADGRYKIFPNRPTHDPDASITLADIDHRARTNGRSVQGPAALPPWFPFRDKHVAKFMEWHHLGSGNHSNMSTNTLAAIIGSAGFDPTSFINFDVSRENRRLDGMVKLMLGESEVDTAAWRSAAVKISLPATKIRRPEKDAPVFEVQNVKYRSFIDVTKEFFQGPDFVDAHLTPYIHCQDPNVDPSPLQPNFDPLDVPLDVAGFPSIPQGHFAVYQEVYESRKMLSEHIAVRRDPTQPNIETVIAALMLYSDATHLANFGSASLWPAYLQFGNLSKYKRASPSLGTMHHLIYFPTNAFSVLAEHSFSVFQILAPDLMHEVELGTWKALFTHLLRILEALDSTQVAELDARFRQISSFGCGTIRKFHNNVSEMKKLAARDFEDILQCILSVLEGLFTDPDAAPGSPNHEKIVLDLVYIFQMWHALAKSRFHHELSNSFFHEVTRELGKASRYFRDITCEAYRTRTFELAAEHAMGDYPEWIKTMGTSDSYSTQTGELHHKKAKGMYGKTNKRDFERQLAGKDHQHRALQLVIKNIRLAEAQIVAAPMNTAEIESEDDDDSNMDRYTMARQGRSLDLRAWSQDHRGDPATANFIRLLRVHLLARLYGYDYNGDEHQFRDDELASVLFKGEKMYEHERLRVNFKTYDNQVDEDIISTRHHPDFMVYSQEDDEDDDHPFWYGRALGIYHILVYHTGSESKLSGPKRMDFLHVRWFGREGDHLSGWKHRRLPKIGFLEPNDGAGPSAFGFIDPAVILRAVHLIPAFSLGKTDRYLTKSIAHIFEGDENKDWVCYYVNIFVDRDMAWRFLPFGHGRLKRSSQLPSIEPTEDYNHAPDNDAPETVPESYTLDDLPDSGSDDDMQGRDDGSENDDIGSEGSDSQDEVESDLEDLDTPVYVIRLLTTADVQPSHSFVFLPPLMAQALIFGDLFAELDTVVGSAPSGKRGKSKRFSIAMQSGRTQLALLAKLSLRTFDFTKDIGQVLSVGAEDQWGMAFHGGAPDWTQAGSALGTETAEAQSKSLREADTHHLKPKLWILFDDPNHIFDPPLDLKLKSARGVHHSMLLPLFIGAEMSLRASGAWVPPEDPFDSPLYAALPPDERRYRIGLDLLTNEEVVYQLINGEIDVDETMLPLHLYKDYKYDREDVWDGLCRSTALLRVIRSLLLGDEHTDRVPSKTPQNCSAATLGIKHVTPGLVVYACVQLRVMMSCSAWDNNLEDGCFDYDAYASMLRGAFYLPTSEGYTTNEAELSQWGSDTLAFIQSHVFGGALPTRHSDANRRHQHCKFNALAVMRARAHPH
ncbi:unnamed protein product [Mycena citricolor]|uniref:Uncharacterized protein n=1 Tax=Mycena citricolor TaxID=2018698 RepID=A0AAD2JXD5_9AGAR|nr:unnamed protein product [Mycena citricolor]